jgi:putative transposase
MAKKGHSEEKIVRALHQVEVGARVSEICREQGISDAAFYIWKKKYAGLGLSELRELRQLREENEAQAAGSEPLLGPAHPAGDREKKAVRPRQRRELGLWTQAVFTLSGRRAAGLIEITRVTLRYRSRRPPQDALRRRLRELAAT